MKKQIEEIYFNCLDEAKCLSVCYEDALKELKNRYLNIFCEKILGKYLIVNNYNYNYNDRPKILYATNIALTLNSNEHNLHILEYNIDDGSYCIACLDCVEEIFDTKEEAELFLTATN